MLQNVSDNYIKDKNSGAIINNNDYHYTQILEKRKNDKFQKYVLDQIEFLIAELRELKEQVCQGK